MAKPKSYATKKIQRRDFMEQELAYSFHLGSDKNKSKLAKKVSKENVSGTTSLSNNAIQNAKDLSDVNKHNLRDYDNQRKLIRTIYGTDDIVMMLSKYIWMNLNKLELHITTSKLVKIEKSKIISKRYVNLKMI